MTLNRSTNDIKKYTGQVFTTEKFSVDKIRNRVRLLTGTPKLLIDQFLHEVLEDFCEKTWLLRKLIQVGDILTEVDNDSNYYSVEIDLENYADGLLVHDINEININGNSYIVTREVYLGDPTGSNETVETAGAYIGSTTYIGPATYLGGVSVHNKGEIKDRYHYEIVDDTKIKIWPMDLNDVIMVPIIFKTSSNAEEIPFILEDYYKNIASGVISEIRKMPRHAAADADYHEMNYQKGITKGKYQYAKQNKGTQIQNTFFAI